MPTRSSGEAAPQVIDPSQPIIDPHHHLWDFPANTYLVPEFLAEVSGGHDLRATVFVQCSTHYRDHGPLAERSLGETAFAAAIAAEFEGGSHGPLRPCAGIVAHADLTLGDDLDALLDRHAEAAGGRLRGIRQITAWSPDASLLNPRNVVRERMLEEPAFRAGAELLGHRGLVFDAWLLHPQLPELAELARDTPDLCIVVNHMGGPVGLGAAGPDRGRVIDAWRDGLARLAAQPNVRMKIGGLGMAMCGFGLNLRETPAPAEEIADLWRPWVREVIDLFGAGRCMFESNFPVDRVSCGYTTLWNAFKLIAADLPAVDRQALFHDTAAQTYRI